MENRIGKSTKSTLTGLFAVWLLAFATSSMAVVETYEFENEHQRVQYMELVETLRCPKCQNQNIDDSNAPIATDMRRAVYKLIQEGKSNDQVVEYMVSRFGEFVVYKPKLDEDLSSMVWAALVCVLGLIFVVLVARKSRANDTIDTLSSADRAKLETLLKDEESK